MKIWHPVRREVAAAWRSLRYDLRQQRRPRPWWAGPHNGAQPREDARRAATRPLGVRAATLVAVMVVIGAASTYVGVVGGLSTLLAGVDTPPAPRPASPASTTEAGNRAPIVSGLGSAGAGAGPASGPPGVGQPVQPPTSGAPRPTGPGRPGSGGAPTPPASPTVTAAPSPPVPDPTPSCRRCPGPSATPTDPAEPGPSPSRTASSPPDPAPAHEVAATGAARTS